MKLTTELYDEPRRDHGICRMILLSAALHVVAIGALLVTGYLRPAKRSEPQVAAYEVTLIGPTGTGKRKTPAEKTSPPAPQATVEKPAAPPAKGEPQEAAPTKPQENPEEQAKPKPQEPPAEKPREVAKTVEPPKPKPAPVVQEKEPPKVAIAVKPVEKKLPPQEKKIEEVKVKEQAKPKVEVRLAEKKEKPQDPPPPQPERVKVQEKKSEPPKTVEKPKAQSVAPKPEKKPQEPVKATAKEKLSEPKKTAKSESAQNRPAAAEPAAKAAPSADATQVRKDEEARDALIASAVERVRTREEAVSRERDIAKAVDRVRRGGSDQEEPGKETKKKPAAAGANTENTEREGDGHVAKAKVYGPEFLAYTEDIKQRVKDNWIVVDRKPKLVAVVQFGVEADGGVVDVELVEPSGDRSFDQSSLRAVKSARLPPPPEAYREDFATQKVHMTFGGEE